MNIVLKNIKHFPSLSQETEAFTRCKMKGANKTG